MRWLILLPALLAGVSHAEAAWTGEAEFGLVVTRGNSETETVNFRLAVENDRERWRHRGRLEAVKAADKDETTAERYLLEANTNYKLNEHAYVFGNLRYDVDRLSGFDFQLSETIGYGRRWTRGTKILELEGGAGARQTRLDDGERDDEGILRGALRFRWAFSRNAEFREEFLVESGETNTLTESVTSLKTNIIGSLAMKLALTLKRNSDVPVGTENTDTLTSVNLVYGF